MLFESKRTPENKTMIYYKRFLYLKIFNLIIFKNNVNVEIILLPTSIPELNNSLSVKNSQNNLPNLSLLL